MAGGYLVPRSAVAQAERAVQEPDTGSSPVGMIPTKKPGTIVAGLLCDRARPSDGHRPPLTASDARSVGGLCLYHAVKHNEAPVVGRGPRCETRRRHPDQSVGFLRSVVNTFGALDSGHGLKQGAIQALRLGPAVSLGLREDRPVLGAVECLSKKYLGIQAISRIGVAVGPGFRHPSRRRRP